MLRLKKKQHRYVIGAVLVLWIAFLLRNPIVYYTQSFFLQRSFMNRIEETKGAEKMLDFRDIRPDFWDELLWFSPYENPCETAAEFQRWWMFCRGAQQDNEIKVFLLREGVPRAGFRILRYHLELIESSGLPKRIPREQALFKFDHFEKFPTVQLQDSQQ